MSRLFAIPLLLIATAPALAADTDAEELAREVAPYLDDQLLGLVHLDLARLDFDEPIRQLINSGAPAKEMEQTRKQAREVLQQLKQLGVKRAYVVLSLDDLPNQPPLLVFPLAKDADDQALAKILKGLTGKDTLHFEKCGNALVGGSERGLKRVRDLKAQVRPELARALTAAGDAPVCAILVPPDHVRRALEEIMPALPREFGGGPTTILTRGLRWGSVALNPSNTTLRVAVQASDEAAAKALQGLVKALFKTIGRDREVREIFPDFDKIAEALLPKTDGDRLTLILKQEQVVALLAPAVKRVQEASRRMASMNNLREIGVSFHAFLDVHNTFPASASYDKQGNPLLSWRVHVLPYLGEQKLYKEFRLNEAWDSEHNKKLIKRMPKWFISSPDLRLAEEGKTTYVVPTGPSTAFPGMKGLGIADITDGTSNTVLALDVDDENAVIWTKPQDLKIDEKAPARGLRKHDGKLFLIEFMDGSCRSLPASIDAKTLLAIFSPSGGEIVNLP